MAGHKGGGPPDPGDGERVPSWMRPVGIGQLQVLSLEAKEAEKRLSPFIVGKSLKNVVGEIESASTEAGGLRYVLRVRDAAQVDKLLSVETLFDGTEVKIQLHPTLNTRRCVISCKEIQHEKDEDIKAWLEPEGVVAVRRITRLVEGKRVNTPTLILTVKGTVVPEHIRVGPLRIKTRIYIPDPMVCYQCFQYGHTKQRCKNSAKCRNCSGSHDLTNECSAETFCFHCKGKHSPASRQCPKYVAEKETLKIQHNKNVSYQEAAKQLAAGGGSFAEATKLQQRMLDAQKKEADEEIKAKDEVIKRLSEMIANLNRRIEELERKKTKKQMKKQQAIEEDLATMTMDCDSESEKDIEAGGANGVAQEPSQQASVIAAVTAAAIAAAAATQTKEIEPSKTGTIPKVGAPKVSDPNSKVGVQSIQIPPQSNFKRQHSTVENFPSSKKTSGMNPPAPPNQKQQPQPRIPNKKH